MHRLGISSGHDRSKDAVVGTVVSQLEFLNDHDGFKPATLCTIQCRAPILKNLRILPACIRLVMIEPVATVVLSST
jgi:hypothetical protein